MDTTQILIAVIGLPAACTPLILGIIKERKGALTGARITETESTVELLKSIIVDQAQEIARLKLLVPATPEGTER